MLWVKAFHLIFMVTWFAGLFYLPRVFVYHAMSTDQAQRDTFKVMERKLLVMTHIGGVLTLLFGVWLLAGWLPTLITLGWMQWKLALIGGLIVYHLYCVKLVSDLANDRKIKGHVWYRLFNEIPVLFLVGIVLLVVVKPSL